MSPMNTELVEVTQADRDAAAGLMVALFENSQGLEAEAAWAEPVRNGEDDEYPVVQAFARHRLQSLSTAREALEIAASVFEEYGRLHRAKLNDGTPTLEYLSFVKKAERNEGYAREMRKALSTLSPTPVKETESPDRVREATDEMVEAALHAAVPGGAEVWCWLPQKDAWTPHETARDVIRAAITGALGRRTR